MVAAPPQAAGEAATVAGARKPQKSLSEVCRVRTSSAPSSTARRRRRWLLLGITLATVLCAAVLVAALVPTLRSSNASSSTDSAPNGRRKPANVSPTGQTTDSTGDGIGADQLPELYTYEIVQELPHDPKAFTQGLEFGRTPGGKEVFWESTGMYGQSEVREVEVDTGKVLRSVSLPRRLFGEGLARANNSLYQLTWRHGTLLEYADVATFHLANFSSTPSATSASAGDSYVRVRDTGLSDGWGIVHHKGQLLVTDSSTRLRWFDPATLSVTRTAVVRDGGAAVPWLNELEMAKGMLWANTWQTECIARINPTTATVTGWLMLAGLTARTRRSTAQQGRPMDVLNGIAHDPQTGRFFVTGKYWAKMYEIRVVKLSGERAGKAAVARARRQCIPRAHSLG